MSNPSGDPDETAAETDSSTGESENSADEERPGPDEVYCRNCGAVISEAAEICPECGVRQQAPPSTTVDRLLDELLGGGNPFVAALYSAIFPGLGQFYNREPKRGVAFVVASLLAMLSMLVFVGFLLYPAVWLYAVYDAYTRAEEVGDGSAV